MNTGHEKDGAFILLPGSAAGSDVVGMLSGFTGLDPYMVRVRLKTRLPLFLCQCRCTDMAGPAGDRMADAGIRFMAMPLSLHDAPFSSIPITGGRMNAQSLVVKDIKGGSHELYAGQDILLLEGCYSSNAADPEFYKAMGESDGRGSRKKQLIFATKRVRTSRVLFIYRFQEWSPFCLLEDALDYDMIGTDRGPSAILNFEILKQQIQDRLQLPVNRDMTQYGYALSRSEVMPEILSGKKQKKEKTVMLTSNEASVNQMSRFLYARWLMGKGVVGRVISGEIIPGIPS